MCSTGLKNSFNVTKTLLEQEKKSIFPSIFHKIFINRQGRISVETTGLTLKSLLIKTCKCWVIETLFNMLLKGKFIWCYLKAHNEYLCWVKWGLVTKLWFDSPFFFGIAISSENGTITSIKISASSPFCLSSLHSSIMKNLMTKRTRPTQTRLFPDLGFP